MLSSLQSADVFQFMCPLSRTVFRDPVVAMDGQTYERSAIVKWFKKHPLKSPFSNKTMPSSILVPNLLLRQQLNSIFPRIKGFYQCVISVLPDEVVLKVFSYLTDMRDLIRVSYVCKSWWRIAQDDSLWESCILPTARHARFPLSSTSSKMKLPRKGKELYIEKYSCAIQTSRILSRSLDLTLVPAKKPTA